MAVNVNETEAKYDVPAGAALPRLDDLPQVAGTSGPAEQQLEAEYYDTDDLRLIRAGITLRRRRGGDDAGWHPTPVTGAGCAREAADEVTPSGAVGGPRARFLTGLAGTGPGNMA
jgi:hypothetical protein